MPQRRKPLSSVEEKKLDQLSPMWQRIARGEVDLDNYTDEEIATARLTMADGRLTPKPAVLPQTFLDEQTRRGLKVAQEKIRDGAGKALDVYLEIMNDKKAPRADRLKAANFFTDRFLGKEAVTLKVAQVDKVESLFERLLEDETALLNEDGSAPPELDVVEGDLL